MGPNPLFADDQDINQRNRNMLQLAIYQLHILYPDFYFKMSVTKNKAMASSKVRSQNWNGREHFPDGANIYIFSKL